MQNAIEMLLFSWLGFHKWMNILFSQLFLTEKRCFVIEDYVTLLKLIIVLWNSFCRVCHTAENHKITVTSDQNVRFPRSKFAPVNVTALSKVTEIQNFFYVYRVQYIHQLKPHKKNRCMRLFSKFGHFSLPGSCGSFLSPKAPVGDENVSHKEKFPEDKTSSATCSTCFRLTNRSVLYIFKFPIIRSVCLLNATSSICVKCSWEVCVLHTMGQVPRTSPCDRPVEEFTQGDWLQELVPWSVYIRGLIAQDYSKNQGAEGKFFSQIETEIIQN